MDDETIHVTVRGDPTDPRSPPDPPAGVVVHRGPPLHPDDVTVVDGVPATSVARTLIDLEEVMDRDELRGCFRAARERLLDLDELAASRERVEWRPSLEMLGG
jgi:hypothetical protein